MILRKFLGILFIFAFIGCSSDSVQDAIDLADGVARKDIDTSRLGVNAFANDPRFGSVEGQLREVSQTLRLRFIRVLFSWNDVIQPTPGSDPNFALYDLIADNIPSGVDALVIITGVPSWMANSGNWIEGNPRTTFVERWVRKVVARYGNRGRIIGWQIWNEPNRTADNNNNILNMSLNPTNYVEMLGRAYSVAKDLAPGKLVVNAATSSVNQNYPDSLDYNRAMRDAGATSFTDVWAIHYYGKQFENVIRGGGVADFLNGLNKRVWVTESGEQGVNDQLAYGEQVWPFLIDEIPSVERIYQYQFTEATPADVTYGLRNLTPGASVSDLYVFLRDR